MGVSPEHGVDADGTKPSTEPRWASSEDWERHRQEITALYKEGNKTLKEVTEHMEKHHQFHATQRMYKRRLNMWKVQKNVKAGEVLAVLRSKEYKPDDPDRPQVVSVNGRGVPVDRVEQYLDRRRRRLQTMRRSGLRIDSEGRFYTAVQLPFSAPEQYQVPEEIGRLIQQYVDGSFTAGAWMAGSTRDELRSNKSTGTTMTLFGSLFDACGLLRRSEVKAGFDKINASLDLLNHVLAEEDPRFLVALFRVLALCQWYNLQEIYRMLLIHLKRLSTIVLGSGHPTTRIFYLLSSLNPADRDLGLKIGAMILCRHMQKYVVKQNAGAYIHLMVNYVDTLESLGMYDESVSGILEAVCFPDERYRWSAETLRLYFEFVLRPRHHVCEREMNTVCPPPRFLDLGEGLSVFSPVLSHQMSEDTAKEIMRYCYTMRTEALREGRATSMIKGGSSMWPSLVTCEDKDRIRILRGLLRKRAEGELPWDRSEGAAEPDSRVHFAEAQVRKLRAALTGGILTSPPAMAPTDPPLCEHLEDLSRVKLSTDPFEMHNESHGPLLPLWAAETLAYKKR